VVKVGGGIAISHFAREGRERDERGKRSGNFCCSTLLHRDTFTHALRLNIISTRGLTVV